MDKRDKVDYILQLVKNQTEEFLQIEEETGKDILTPMETVTTAVEIISGHSLNLIAYSSPVGEVDKTNISFMLADDLEVPIYKKEQDESLP